MIKLFFSHSFSLTNVCTHREHNKDLPLWLFTQQQISLFVSSFILLAD